MRLRFVFIAPSHLDDLAVHLVGKRRQELAASLCTPVRSVEYKNDREKRFIDYLESIENDIGEPATYSDFLPLRFVTHGGGPEEEFLDNSWSSIRLYHDYELRELRRQIEKIVTCEDETVILHVDLGHQLSSLYAAYFAVRTANDRTTLTFHAPSEEHENRFTLGGRSLYAQVHPLLRRKLATTAISNARFVFTSSEDMAGVMQSLFPRLAISYAADPLVAEISLSEQTSLSLEMEGI